MDDKKILALMYDFYNQNTLKGQNDDIQYYINQIKKYKANKVLVIGAGTGRVAIPLSDYCNITALDFDSKRLDVLRNKSKNNINIICNDFLKFHSDEIFDLIIIPYSTLQFDMDLTKLQVFFKKICEIIGEKSIVIFDVSESFNTKCEKNRELVLEGFCNEINDNIKVYYSSKRYNKYIEFFIEYHLVNNNYSVLENERYYYYDKDLLLKTITDYNLNLLKIDDGYNGVDFKHKHLYHVKKLKR